LVRWREASAEQPEDADRPVTHWTPSEPAAEAVQRILAFIDYFNQTMAKSFKWTYSGRPLTV
jgi:hypothetical protein